MSPKVQSYSAPWLDPHTPGAGLFQAAAAAPGPTHAGDRSPRAPPPWFSAGSNESGARRTIVHRGTEAFVAVRREIRWGDLAYIRERYDEAAPHVKKEDDGEAADAAARPSSAVGVRVGAWSVQRVCQ
jgi:nucleoporin NUP82